MEEENQRGSVTAISHEEAGRIDARTASLHDVARFLRFWRDHQVLDGIAAAQVLIAKAIVENAAQPAQKMLMLAERIERGDFAVSMPANWQAKLCLCPDPQPGKPSRTTCARCSRPVLIRKTPMRAKPDADQGPTIPHSEESPQQDRLALLLATLKDVIYSDQPGEIVLRWLEDNEKRAAGWLVRLPLELTPDNNGDDEDDGIRPTPIEAAEVALDRVIQHLTKDQDRAARQAEYYGAALEQARAVLGEAPDLP